MSYPSSLLFPLPASTPWDEKPLQQLLCALPDGVLCAPPSADHLLQEARGDAGRDRHVRKHPGEHPRDA